LVDKASAVGFTVALLALAFTLVTGQIAYGNLYGPLHNDSKLPEVKVVQAYPYRLAGDVYLALNLSDVAGPDAYPASVVALSVYNSTFHETFISVNLSAAVINVTQAPWNLAKRAYTNGYSGLVIPLGSDAVFLLRIGRISAGVYTLALYTPAVKPVVTSLMLPA
jgi:thiosulfate dehydrogenase [quinone] small subunit